MTQIKNNKMIAKFMGLLIQNQSDFDEIHKQAKDKGMNLVLYTPTPNQLKYNVSWDWIMPVVEKIIKYKVNDKENHYLRTFGMKDEEGNFMVRFNGGFLHSDPDLLIATYNAVCEFIEWYNENKK